MSGGGERLGSTQDISHGQIKPGATENRYGIGQAAPKGANLSPDRAPKERSYKLTGPLTGPVHCTPLCLGWMVCTVQKLLRMQEPMLNSDGNGG